jgi:hypothetical protein
MHLRHSLALGEFSNHLDKLIALQRMGVYAVQAGF